MRDINLYQERAWGFALPSARYSQYLLPGLTAEVGELMTLYAKAQRDGPYLDKEKVKKELGDILWFVAGIASYNGWTLEEVAAENISKLESRKQRGTIQGSGDNR